MSAQSMRGRRSRLELRGKGSGAVEGVSELLLKLDAAPEEITKRLKATIARKALNIADDAYVLAPVRTGMLRGSLDVKFENNGLTARIVSTAPHSHLIEFGTLHADAQPFFFPAYRMHRPKTIKEIKFSVRRALKKVAAMS